MSGELPLLDILLPIDLATRKPDLATSIACDEAKRGYGDRTMRAPKQADYIAVRDRRMGLSSEVIMKACWEAMVTGQSTQADKLALKGNESLTLLAIVEANKSAEKAGQPRPDATSTMRRCWRAMIGVKLQVAKRYASESNKAFTLLMIREVARAAAKVGMPAPNSVSLFQLCWKATIAANMEDAERFVSEGYLPQALRAIDRAIEAAVKAAFQGLCVLIWNDPDPVIED